MTATQCCLVPKTVMLMQRKDMEVDFFAQSEHRLPPLQLPLRSLFVITQSAPSSIPRLLLLVCYLFQLLNLTEYFSAQPDYLCLFALELI